MEIPALLTVLPIGLLFLLSGLVINAVQAIVFLSIRPLSRSLQRQINGFLAELLWLQPVWLLDCWAGVKVQLHADPETYQVMGKEHALVISNHRGDIDWLIGWILAQRSGCLGSALAVMKKSSKFLPVIGWSMWFSEYIFLEGSWAKDQTTIKWGLQRLKDFPRSFWLALFVEGTRITPAKLIAAQEYATSKGLPYPRNVLIPRTKGFVLAVNIMRDFVPAIYDMTVITPKDAPAPTLLRIFKGQSSVSWLQECRKRGIQNVGFMDPDVIHEKSVRQWPNRTLTNIFMALDEQRTCEYILLPYNFNFHRILLCIEIDKARVVVLDPKRYPIEKYQELINLLQKAWARFMQERLGATAENLVELHFKTDFPCMRQADGNNLCGYYICEFIRTWTMPKQTTEKEFQINTMAEELIEPERVRAVQEEICGFLLDEVINPAGEFYADPRVSVGLMSREEDDDDI